MRAMTREISHGTPDVHAPAEQKNLTEAEMARRMKTSRVRTDPSALLGDIRKLIEASRQRAAWSVNAELTLLFWRIGHRIYTEVLAGQRAGYGEEILPTLATRLALDYGRGFGEKNLRRMVKFAVIFPDEPILATLSRQLSWSHLVLLLGLKDPLQRDYYVQMATAERWSVRTLRERIDSMLYERTVLSKKSGETIAQELAKMRDAQRMSPDLVMRDPYILDFLGLRDTWQEGDLEAAIIREMESFLLELGVGFSYLRYPARYPAQEAAVVERPWNPQLLLTDFRAVTTGPPKPTIGMNLKLICF
jgi:predicted nuclease of restriction endonuclease-like (RecB) superfamily